jgi:RNA polymerase sigma factor (TIGR02999 family)
MAYSSTSEVTRLLLAWGNGDEKALAQLVPLVEAELHRLAQHYLKQERRGHTLQTMALVNEAYLRLIDWKNVQWQNRAHFFGVAANLMRRILVDHARRRQLRKRSGDTIHISLSEATQIPQRCAPEVLALNDALDALAEMGPRQSRIVELRFFGGLTEKEVAKVLSISERTVRNEWSLAQAWLYRELNRETKNDA